MPSYYTSDTLIDAIKRRAHIPNSQVTFTNDDLLAFANDELKIGLVPSMLQVHQEFFVYDKTTALVANVSSYDIPPRSIGQRVRDVFYVDANSNVNIMAKINPDNLPLYSNTANATYPYAFYVQNNVITLVPTVTQGPTGSILFKYFLRPNELVTYTDNICEVLSISGGDVTVDAVPSTFSTSTPLDIQEAIGGHRLKAYDISPTSVNSASNIITFDTDEIPSNLAVGDYIGLAGNCYIPMVPDELHSVLAQRVVCELLEAQKDAEALASARSKLAEMELKTGILINNRTEGQPTKAVSMFSPIRSGKFRYRRN